MLRRNHCLSPSKTKHKPYRPLQSFFPQSLFLPTDTCGHYKNLRGPGQCPGDHQPTWVWPWCAGGLLTWTFLCRWCPCHPEACQSCADLLAKRRDTVREGRRGGPPPTWAELCQDPLLGGWEKWCDCNRDILCQSLKRQKSPKLDSGAAKNTGLYRAGSDTGAKVQG